MTSKPSASGSDWTNILSDPTIASHLGELLKAYREAPPEKREQSLLEALKKIKGNETKAQPGAAKVPASTSIPAAAVATSTVRPLIRTYSNPPAVRIAVASLA